MVHLMEACLLTALQAYLLGSLLFGVLVSKLFYHDDVRLHGSGNAGMTSVLVGAGAALATEPIACLVLLVIFLVEVAITHIVSLGSIIIAALYPVLTLCYWLWKGTDAASLVFITVCCVLMGAYVIWLERSNIQRLKNGTEYRFGEKKKENQ